MKDHMFKQKVIVEVILSVDHVPVNRSEMEFNLNFKFGNIPVRYDLKLMGLVD